MPRFDETREPPCDFPDDLLEDIRLLDEEAAWMLAVQTPDARVVWSGEHGPGSPAGLEPWVGRVVVGAKDPVNGVKMNRLALVEHRFVDHHGALVVRRWYPALNLSPAPRLRAVS